MRIGFPLLVLLVFSGSLEAGDVPRLRGASPGESRMIENTLQRSPTARALADRIEASDLIVYVQLTIDLPAGRAATRLVAATDSYRYLRVVIGAMTHPADRGALLAHELQHALEIGSAREVRDVSTLRRLYERIGEDRHARFAFETAAARDVAQRVQREMTVPRDGTATAYVRSRDGS